MNIMEPMRLTSTAFTPRGQIPVQYTCDGEKISPQLAFENVPEEAQSLVLIMDDPDVPTELREDGMWDHWVVYDIDASVREVPEGTEPPGILGTGTSGAEGYHPPCPPNGEHRYIFHLYALDSMLELPRGATKQDVLAAMNGRIVAEAQLVGLYGAQRKRA
jgi:hypothetical protein